MRMLARRILFYAITALAAVTVDFMIPRVMPGNPVEALLSHMQGQVTVQNIHALEAQYGLNSSAGLWGQYTSYWANLAHGNLGLSTSSYPATVTSVLLGTLLGILVAWRRGSWLDSLLPATTFFQAAPYFFIAFLALDLFSTRLGWFPSGRAYGQLDFP